MKFSRRRTIGYAVAGLAASTLTVNAKEKGETSEKSVPEDRALASALRSPQSHILHYVGSLELKGDGHGRTLDIGPTLDVNGQKQTIRMNSDSMRVFRANLVGDDGTFDWRYHKQKGTFQTKERSWSSSLGAILMVFREGPDIARVYVMSPDTRC